MNTENHELQALANHISALTESINTNTEKIIKSQNELSNANSRYALALNILTGLLVIISFIQIF